MGAYSTLIFFIFIAIGNWGDFNEILKPNEKLRRLPWNVEMMENFQNVLQECKLLDIGLWGYPYT